MASPRDHAAQERTANREAGRDRTLERRIRSLEFQLASDIAIDPIPGTDADNVQEALEAFAAGLDGFALETVMLTAGVGLSGGGDLSADRTFDLDATIDDLTDVDTSSTPPTDQQALLWDDGAGLWVPGDVASGGGGTGTLIGEVIAPGGTNTLTISAIPTTFKSLVIEVVGRCGGDLGVRFNGDTGANYSRSRAYNDPSGPGYGQDNDPGATRLRSLTDFSLGTSPVATYVEITVPGYCDTTFNKSGRFSGRQNSNAAGTNGYSLWGSWQWASTAAINAVTAESLTGNWVAGTILRVYGLGGSGATALSPESETVLTSENTTSTGYTDLATVGPAVTLNTGTDVLVTLSSTVLKTSGGAGFNGFMSVAVSGATTIAAIDDNATTASSAGGAGFADALARTFKLSGLTPGANTFTAKYRVNGSDFTFHHRDITVIPL